jgi:poly(3-hydroxybutyrate) depolymerase
MKNTPRAISVLGLVAALTSCSSTTSTQEGTGGSSAGSGGHTSSQGGSAAGGSTGTGGKAATGGSVGASGGVVGTGGSSASGGTTSKPGTGGATASGGNSGPAGGNGGHPGTGGSSASGGTTSQPGTGGGPASGGNPGRDGGSATGGAIDGGGSTPAGQSTGCGKTSTITSSQYNNGNPISITVNGSQRRYILSVPTNYDNTKPYKFVLGIHALDSNDKTVYSWGYYGLQSLSNNTVIFAAPNGVKNNSPCSGTGTGESGCGWPSGNNNMELMDAVVKQVTDNFCVDMNHIYATGWSYGASMSYEVGCERPLGGTKATWGVRAIALYSVAQMSGSCKPSIPIGYYLSHGTNDTVLSYDGGVNLTKNYATTNGCTWATPPKASGSHICTNLSGCKTGYETEFCSFVGGHTPFPDSGNQSSSWGPAEVWKFFSQF